MSLKERLKDVLENKAENNLLPFFWQHGEDEDILREYMNAISNANIKAVCVESRPHPDFVGPKWWADMDVILDEAQKLDMKVWILDDEHFPTGYAAGAVENAPAELCHQYLDYNTVSVCGPLAYVEIDASKYARPQPVPWWIPPPPAPKREFKDDHLFEVIACRLEENGTLGERISLTDCVSDGKLLWNVPEGYWNVYVIYLTRDAKGRNDYINMLDYNSCRILIDTVYEPHYNRYKDLFGNVIAGFFSDEPPIGNSPTYTGGDLIGKHDMPLSWSAAMPESMEREYGAGWRNALPLLWNKGRDKHETARIRTGYMNSVSKLVSKCFSEQIGQWCESHNVEYIGHMLEDCDINANLGPGMGHFFRGLSGQHMAGIDNIGGHILIGGQYVHRGPNQACQDDAGFYHYTLGRLGASHATIDPKKQGRCICENFGAYGWQIGVRMEKYLTDHFLARGVNRFIPHAFSPKAFPDRDCPPHFYAHGENPQYRAFGELMAYTNRICHLIDGGKACTPVALLYHGESQWSGAYESNIFACKELTRNQIGFTIIPADVFDERGSFCTSFEADKKLLSINGNKFNVLVISGCEFLPKSVALFVQEAVNSGFPVIFTGTTPIGVCDASEEESDSLTASFKSCCVTDVKNLAETLDKYILRDVCLEKEFGDLTVCHYKNENDIYLILNEHPSHRFCGEVKIPKYDEVIGYDAWRNKIYIVNSKAERDCISVSMELEPLQMQIIICGEGIPEANEKIPSTAGFNAVKIHDFTITRCSAKEYPHFRFPEKFETKCGMGLQHPDFSGFYRYESTIMLNRLKKALLKIDDVFESAEVFINGKSAGMLTSQPYIYDLSDYVCSGQNEIAIEVATTLERKTAAMGIDLASLHVPSPLSPTGIVGEVTVYSESD